LIDVREACEHALGSLTLDGRTAYSLPLSRLAGEAAWLAQETRALVFFCRSGNRSAEAVRVAQACGHRQVRHLAGGLALLAPVILSK
jgi:rhodanese-related sulfurtransferase